MVKKYTLVFADTSLEWCNVFSEQLSAQMTTWPVEQENLPFGFATYNGDVMDLYLTDGDKNVAFVSTGNSLGYMQRGVDATYARMFPWLSECISEFIQNAGLTSAFQRPFIPIGSAISIPVTSSMSPEWLYDQNKIVPIVNTWYILAPSRWMDDSVANTQNAYWAFVALLGLLEKMNVSHEFDYVVVAGVCTGIGQMTLDEAARQVIRACEHYIQEKVGGIDGERETESTGELKPRDKRPNAQYLYWDEPNVNEQPQHYSNREFFGAHRDEFVGIVKIND